MSSLDKVFILVERVDWEGDTILGVYEDSVEAYQEGERLASMCPTPRSTHYRVLNYPVLYKGYTKELH